MAPTGTEPLRRGGRPRPARWLAFCAGFAAAAALAGAALLRAGEAWDLPLVKTQLDVLPELQGSLALARERARTARLVLFVGDSLAIDRHAPDTSIPVRLRERLSDPAAGLPGVELVELTAPALSVYSHYFLSECALATQPELVVLALNPRSFAPAWLADERIELAGWLPARRWPEALGLPLHAVGLSADRLVFSRAVVSAGGVRRWRALQAEQVRLSWGVWTLADRLQRAAGDADGLDYRRLHDQHRLRREKTAANRATAEFSRAMLGPLLAGLRGDAAGIAVLDALLARLERAGVPALVYLAPINVEHLRSLGLYDEQGVARSATRLRAVANARGADFLDLHARLPDSAFGDHLDHLEHGTPDEGSQAVAAALAAGVIERMRRPISARPSGAAADCPTGD